MVWQSVYDKVVDYILFQTERSDFIGIIKLGKLLREANLIYRSNDKVTKPVTGLSGRAIQFNTEKFPDLIEEIVEINKESTLNTLLEEYALDHERNNRVEEEKREHKINKRELKRLKNSLYENSKDS